MKQILFRAALADKEEFDACKSVFGDNLIRHRSDIKPGALVVPRYSALPYYGELEYDCGTLGGHLINSYAQHKWIANFEWYKVPELAKNTFKSYTQEEFVWAPEGKYVVKGVTNSAKWNWNTKMFAPNKKEAVRIGCDIREDSLIGTQEIIYRKYVPLDVLEIGLNGLPFANEWRFFFGYGHLIDYGFYWNIAENVPPKYACPVRAKALATSLAEICCDYANFYVLDIAMKKTGEPVLVEINDGSMSGLSSIDNILFYKGVNDCL